LAEPAAWRHAAKTFCPRKREVIVTFLLLLSLQCLLPIFDSFRADEFLGLSIVNRDNQPREFTVTVTAPEGTDTQTGRLSIPAGGQRAQLINEILGLPRRPTSGWIRVDSTAPGCTSFVSSGNEAMLDSAEAMPNTSTTILIPNVSVFTGFVELNHLDTHIALVNPGSTSALVTAGLFGLDAAMTGSTVVALPPGGSSTLAVSEAFRDVLPDNRLGGRAFQGYMRLNSSVPIAAWARIETPLSRKLARGRGLEEIRPRTLVVIPHFAIGAQYRSILNLVNPTSDPSNLELEAVDDRGNVIGQTARLTLAAGGVLRSGIAEVFRIDSRTSSSETISGSIRIRGYQGGSLQLVGDIEIFSYAFDTIGSSVLYPIQDSAATDWLIPFATSSDLYYSGYAIANPNELLAVQTDVHVEVLNSAGAVIDRKTISLSARSRQASIVDVRLQSGYLRFTSNMPIHIVGAIGTRNGRLLDQLPALR
jgi:hypothetical protein